MISPEQREEWIIRQARRRPGAERAVFLDGACAGDSVLRERLERLLAAPDQPEEVLAEGVDVATVKATIKLEFADEPADEAVGRTIGRYKLLEKVGEGGCGVVYVADQTEPVRRRVALKVIKLGMDTKQVVARFEAERQALAMMDHPNIAKVLDAGTTDTGRPYFIMELVRGIKITDYCDQEKVPTRERLELFIQICQAIQHAHQKGIIHRDIKPSNILVTLHDGVPVPKVIDFGIAKATEGRLTDATVYTQLHQFIGTPAYMSPEQAEMSGLDIDTRSDIYSLGVLLYELLTGKTPFDAQELMSQGIDAMRRTIRERDPIRPSTKLATLQEEELSTTAKRRSVEVPKLIHLLKGDLDWIVMKCLEKDRTRRYETANGLAVDIRRHLNMEPVVARPPSKWYEFRKTVRRHKFGFAATAAIIIVLAVGIAVASWQAMRALRAQREADTARNGEREQRLEAESAQKLAETNAEKFKSASIQSRRNEYAADMFAATAEIARGNYVNARNLLRKYFAHDGLEELRGFEWRYWWQLSAGQQLASFPIRGRVNAIAWSPDGLLIAEGNSAGTVELLRSDLREAVSVLTVSSADIVSVAFSHDGNGLAIGSADGRTSFWDVRDGHLLFDLPHKYGHPQVACSPVGPRMAVATGGDWWGQTGGDVYLVDTTSRKEFEVLPKAGGLAVFSPDGKRIATANYGNYASGSQKVVLWDVASGQKLGVLPDIRQVLAMVFSPDGNLLAIANFYGEVSLWNLRDFSHEVLRKQTRDTAKSVAFSPDGRRLVVGLQTHEVEEWDVSERRLFKTLHGHTGEINGVALSPDGTRLASGSADGTVRLWDPQPSTVQKLIPEFNNPYGYLGCPTFSPDSRWVAVSIRNGDVQIVDPTTEKWNVHMVLTNAGFPLFFSKNASTLLTLAGDFKTLRRWNLTSGEPLSTTTLNSTNANVVASAITPDGNRLALSTGRRIEVFDTRTGHFLDDFNSPMSARCLGFSADGRLLAISGNNNGGSNAGVLWDTAAGRLLWTLAGHRDRVDSISFSPDQKTVATASWDNTVCLWDVATGKRVKVLIGHKAGRITSAFSPDGGTLATASDDRTIKFWNLVTFREVGSIQLNAPANFLAFSPDGKMLVANNGEEDGLRCWRAPSLVEIDAAKAKDKMEGQQP